MKKTKTVMLSVRIDARRLALLRGYARAMGKSLREAIEESIERTLVQTAAVTPVKPYWKRMPAGRPRANGARS